MPLATQRGTPAKLWFEVHRISQAICLLVNQFCHIMYPQLLSIHCAVMDMGISVASTITFLNSRNTRPPPRVVAKTGEQIHFSRKYWCSLAVMRPWAVADAARFSSTEIWPEMSDPTLTKSLSARGKHEQLRCEAPIWNKVGIPQHQPCHLPLQVSEGTSYPNAACFLGDFYLPLLDELLFSISIHQKPLFTVSKYSWSLVISDHYYPFLTIKHY